MIIEEIAHFPSAAPHYCCLLNIVPVDTECPQETAAPFKMFKYIIQL